ncbi:PREDICTED: moesin/ezrin/radixin homolog 1-like isoform X2 [Nicrophorus vespilloides]|uniref:Moesin/ezrin/radixin homolog 1-like isoform X2 n=1 Tax=Nicrophorus vespilloides TaxID=110193 RepID=A0ABM1MXZ6_NICVS|nr:PREDICTED: moesin/ezrin/radixin homolog 1-like isoform X2 [Nicrophorus vespilloides]
MGSSVRVRVTTVLKELEFSIAANKSARELFLHICKSIGIRETWFFGLYFMNESQEKIWIDASKKKMSIYRPMALKLQFMVKYCPEDVQQDLIEHITLKHFYLQLRSDIMSDNIYCPPDTCILLASYFAQVKYGDYDDRLALEKEKFLPERVYKQYNLNKTEFLTAIISMWKKHLGMNSDEGMLEYLKIVQNLEMFGIHYFSIFNNKGSKVLMGVYPLGLNVFKLEDKLNPVIMFPWSEIGHLNFKGKKFIIKTIDKAAADFIFFTEDPKKNKRILNLGIGYHQLYRTRRQPESLEIAQMREIATHQKIALQAQKDKFIDEVKLRQSVEIRYKEEIKILQDEIKKMQKNLMDSQETIERLNKQLADIELSKKELESKQRELEQMMKRLEESKNMEAAEKLKLEQEIKNKQSELSIFREEVSAKDEETKRLQSEIEAAKQYQEKLLQQQLEETARREDEQKKLESLVASAHSEIPELTKVNEELSKQLEQLQTKLESTRNEALETKEDKIHRENVRDGRDKYKTLQAVRKGNTTRRVDLFENL